MSTQHRQAKQQRGVVLPLVLILSLVLAASVATFIKRAVIDTKIVRNRDKVAVAEALARSGIQIARAVLHEQLQRKIDVGSRRVEGVEVMGNTEYDLTARLGQYELLTPEGAILRISIFDNRARLNLNSLVRYASAEKAHGVDEIDKALLLDGLSSDLRSIILEGFDDSDTGVGDDKPSNPREGKASGEPSVLGDQEGKPIPDAEEFLVDFLDRVIEEMDGTAADKEYDKRELARNLIDYMDHDHDRIGGGDEDVYYQRQDPPYLPANRPLLSVLELGLVEGFDYKLVKRLEQYLTVYPLFAAEGVNINTAPGHVLGSIWHGDGESRRLLSQDDVVGILAARDEGSYFCDDAEVDPDRCITLADVGIVGDIFPPTSLPARSWVYTVLSQVTYDDIERSVEAVINMTQTGKDMPFLLYWRMQ